MSRSPHLRIPRWSSGAAVSALLSVGLIAAAALQPAAAQARTADAPRPAAATAADAYKSSIPVLVANDDFKTNTAWITDVNAFESVNLPVANGPQAVAVSPNGQYGYVLNASGELDVLDDVNTPHPSAGATVRVSTCDESTGQDAVIAAPDGKRVYVANDCADTVSVISDPEGAKPKVTGSIHVGDTPMNLAITPDGKYLYVANYNADTVSVITGPENADPAVGSLTVGSVPVGIAISPDGKRVYVANSQDGSVSVISGADSGDAAVSDTIQLGSNNDPFDIAVAPNGKYAYATANGGLIPIDLSDDQPGTLIPGEGLYVIRLSADGKNAYGVTQDAFGAENGVANYVYVYSGIGTGTPRVTATWKMPAGTYQQAAAAAPPSVGIYSNFTTAAAVNTALNDGWQAIANVAGVSQPGKMKAATACQSPWTHPVPANSDAVVERALSAASQPAQWAASYWTAATPPESAAGNAKDMQAAGAAAGRAAAENVEAAFLRDHAAGKPGGLPAYVVLDPEGIPCPAHLGSLDHRNGKKVKEYTGYNGPSWDGEVTVGGTTHLTEYTLAPAEARSFTDGWDAGVRALGLEPALYVTASEYTDDHVSTWGVPVILAQSPASAKTPKVPVEGPIVGYAAFYAPTGTVVKAGKKVPDCGDAATSALTVADIKGAIAWGGAFISEQFSSASLVCPMKPAS